jgi:glycogen operon protein
MEVSALVSDPYATKLAGPIFDAHAGPALSEPRTGPLCVSVVCGPNEVEVSQEKLTRGDSTTRVVYEAHVKGATMSLEAIPRDLRGTYLGLSSEPFIEHLVTLGVTTLELLPVFAFTDELELTQRGLVNFWGYNPISFFAPSDRYRCRSSDLSTLDQMRSMVRSLHDAGIEVVLDVVYNHTAEGGSDGPTLSFKGIDRASYYLLEPGSGEYVNWSGTGNTFNLTSDHGLRVVMDSLRFWRSHVGVDGYRFDLGSALCQVRDGDGVRHTSGAASTFFRCLSQDPLLRDAFVVTEPWDATFDGQLIGSFGGRVGEWNGRFRDDVRRFWTGDSGAFGAFAQRISGSQELFDWGSRTVSASVNYLTSHDGMTLSDLVTYENKQNQANGWDNTDGQEDEVLATVSQGQADEIGESVEVVRRRAAVSLLASLLLSKGTPMLLYGDEFLRTQGGNNNAYCQDEPRTWTNFDPLRSIVPEIQALVQLRSSLSLFSERGWFRPRKSALDEPFDPTQDDVEFYTSAGVTFSAEEWADSRSLTLTTVTRASDNRGHVVVVALYNPSLEIVTVVLPPIAARSHFVVVFDGGLVDHVTTAQDGIPTVRVKPKGCAVLLR